MRRRIAARRIAARRIAARRIAARRIAARRIAAAAPLLLLAPPALAHTAGGGVAGGLLAGFAHPFGGWDHLLAMLAVGLWAGLAGRAGAPRAAMPTAFLGGMAGGVALGAAPLPLPMIEAGILASVLTLGVLVAAAVRPPLPVGVALLAAFGLLHGYAHALEIGGGAGADRGSHAVGLLAATALLHAVGLALATHAAARGGQGRRAIRLAGGATACLALAAAGLG